MSILNLFYYVIFILFVGFKGGMLKEHHVITAIGGDDSKTTEFIPYQDVRSKYICCDYVDLSNSDWRVSVRFLRCWAKKRRRIKRTLMLSLIDEIE